MLRSDDFPFWSLIPPSDPGPLIDAGPRTRDRTTGLLLPGPRIVGLGHAGRVPDGRPDESAALEALDVALERAIRTRLTRLQAGVLRRRFWNGWSWYEIGRYYFPREIVGLGLMDVVVGVQMLQWEAITILRDALHREGFNDLPA